MKPFRSLPSPTALACALAVVFSATLPGRGAPVDDAMATLEGQVGRLGSISNLVIEGNTVISATALRRALSCDVQVILASHPAADLAGFPPVIAKRLRAGYRNSGYPEARVNAVVVGADDGKRMVVRIHEGPRYRMGQIRIEGAKEIPAGKLRQLLLAEPGEPSAAAVLVQAVREVVGKYEDLLPQPEPEDGDDAADNPPANDDEDSLGGLSASLPSSSAADWVPGEPVGFGAPDEDPLADHIRRHLATMERPLTRFRSAFDLRGDGTADLVIRIAWEGPPVVADRIRVLGAKANTAEEIIAAAGLKPGQALLPEALDHAMLALWNTGRFFPFAITPHPRSGNDAEIDLVIQVREIPNVPALRDKVPPELETGMRFIRILNEWLASADGDDLLVSVKDGGGELTIGLSGRDGLVFTALPKNAAARGTLCLARDGAFLKVHNKGRDSLLRLPLPTARIKAGLRLVPSIDSTHPGPGQTMSFDFFFGASSSLNLHGRPPVGVLVSPAMPLLKPEAFRRVDDRFVDFSHDGRTLIRLDLATAALVSTADSAVEYRKGVVRELQENITAELDQPGRTGGLLDWIESAKTGLNLLAGDDADAKPDPDLVTARKWLDFAALLAKPEITRPFADLWAKWTAEKPAEESFDIPLDPAAGEENAMLSLLVGLGAASLGELLAPPDSWVSKFTREIVFIQSGETRYTARVMRELLDDPAMGPCGNLIAGRVMQMLDPEMAARFLRKARAQATTEGFQEDWMLLLRSPLGLDGTLGDALAAVAAIPPDHEAELIAPLSPEEAAWLRDFLARLRQRPAEQDLAVWLTPNMDALWDRLLRARFLETVERLLNPPADAKLVAALVNGRPVMREWVAQIEQPGFDHFLLPRLTPDPARPWTRRPALAEFVRLLLWPQPQAANAPAAKAPFDTRQIGADLQQIAATIKRPDDGELEQWWRKNGAVLGRQAHLHSFRTTVTADTPEARVHATTLVRAVAALVRNQLPFVTLVGAASKDKTCGLVGDCSKDSLLVDMRPEFYQSLRALEAGESSGVVGVGATRWIATVVEWQPAPSPPLAKLRDQAVQAWAYDHYLQAVQRRLQPAENTANIRLLDDPAPPADDKAFFQDLLTTSPDSPVARLAVFWHKARADEADAGDALAAVLATGALEATALKALAKALADLDRRDLADRCTAAVPE